MNLVKLTFLCAIASFEILTGCAVDAKPASLKYTGSNTPEQGCLLPAVDSTTVGKRVINMFAQIKHGQTLQQVQSLIDLSPILPKMYKSKYFPMSTLSYDIPLADELILNPAVSFDQNLKVNIVTIGLAQNPGEEDQISCHWKFVPVR